MKKCLGVAVAMAAITIIGYAYIDYSLSDLKFGGYEEGYE